MARLAVSFEPAWAQPAAKPRPAAATIATAATTLTAPTAKPGQAVPAAHQLTGVRVRPQADSLRLIFLFDRLVPYTVREDFARQRVEIDLLNTRLDFLPPELARVGDPRLEGIWIKRLAPGMVTLELRLPSSAMRLEPFTLDQPPAIVIDLFRTDAAVARVDAPDLSLAATGHPAPGAPETTSTTETATAAGDPLRGAHGSALPDDLDARPALPQAATAVAATTATASSDTQIAQDDVAGPHPADYDDFPVNAIQVASPLAHEIYNDFLARRWANVLSKGVKYLERNRINEETRPVLYMLAEARWQLGSALKEQPLTDMKTYYEQALRNSARGDLGAFGHWRMAQLADRQEDQENEVNHLKLAGATTNPELRKKVVLLLTPALSALGRNDEALALIDAAKPQLNKTEEQVERFVREAAIRHAKGDEAGAWAAYQQANALDPNWKSLDKDGCETMARVAIATGNYPQARQYIEFINNEFSYRSDEQKVNLALLYADVLARQGDIATAEQTYAELLTNLGDTPKGIAVQQLMLKLHPQAVTESETRYCELLWRQGKIREAMRELDRAWRQCLSEGISTAPLEPSVSHILPSFMEYSARASHPSDVLQAWKLYGFAVKDPVLRRRCLLPQIDALDKMGAIAEPLALIEQYKQQAAADAATTDTSPAQRPLIEDRLALLEAKLRLNSNQPASAIPLLESLVATTTDEDLLSKAYAMLAKAYKIDRQPVPSAQALQTLANLPGTDLLEAGQALLSSGETFLKEGMPLQTIEGCLKALLIEKELHEGGRDKEWGATGNAIRLELARAYHARADYPREVIILKDYLTRPGLSDNERNQANLMLGRTKLIEGQTDEAGDTYQTILNGAAPAKGNAAPEAGAALYEKTAGQTRQILEWNREHPEWAIDMKSPASDGK